MFQHNTAPVTPTPATAPAAQEFYLPRGGGIDPDFHVPADREHVPGRISRWIAAIPGFGRQRS